MVEDQKYKNALLLVAEIVNNYQVLDKYPALKGFLASQFTLLKDGSKRKELYDGVNIVLDSLTERESRVLKLRYGLEDGRFYKYREIGESYNVTPERVRQIMCKAHRRMRHPSRIGQLEKLLISMNTV